ncbi:MAG TPA: prolipoprotein diacylglyceryl transferase [Flavobacteriaceae bacterium]|nr:prolipoprotein diacylglyceryl transferase [Flavobacteriaceae bacterium]HIP26471.1 prolipoprotein diacylglyceryl transferase [Flavobacteriaceae bacterium]
MIYLGINWNPSPEIINIFGISVRYYGLMFVLAFLLGAFLLKKIYKNEGVNEDHVESLFLYVVVATILGARLGEVFFYSWEYYQNHLLEILLPIKETGQGSILGIIDGWEFIGFRGLASHGATIGIILGMYIYTKKYTYKSWTWILDRIVVPIAIGASFVRIGNLMNSEIVGKITDSNIGFRFIRDKYSSYEAMHITKTKTADKAFDLIQNSPRFKSYLDNVPLRYPTQIFESLSYVVIFIILWYVYWKTDKKDKKGYIFGLFMVLLWSVRLIIEFFKEAQIEAREDWVGILNTGQLLSIPMILVGLYFMFRKVKVSN